MYEIGCWQLVSWWTHLSDEVVWMQNVNVLFVPVYGACVSEIKQKGKTKWHQVGVYPSMVGLWVCPFLADKNSLITHTNIWNSAWGKNRICKVYCIYVYPPDYQEKKSVDIQVYKCPPLWTFAVFLIPSYCKYVDKHWMLQCRECWRVGSG